MKLKMLVFIRDQYPHEQNNTKANSNSKEESEIAVRGTRPLSDIYERCNAALLELAKYMKQQFLITGELQ